MKTHAYVLLADPAFLVPSLSAYYGLVDRVIVSFDRNARSWTGTEVPIQTCLAAVEALDVDGKCVLAPGDYARLEHHPMLNETFQRQQALDEASEGADWVLQLDTDEVMANPAAFKAVLSHAHASAAVGLHYPSRWLYTRTGRERYLERTRRFWRTSASYPGALAVRAGARLRYARQLDGALYRADFSARNTDAGQARDVVVDEVVGRADAVLHYSWVRSPDEIKRKVGWSGHSRELQASNEYERWETATTRPWMFSATSALRHDGEWMRVVRAPDFEVP